MRFLALAVALTVVSFLVAFASAETVFFGFGPADRDYAEGFRVGWGRGTTARWSREEARVELPIRVRGQADLVFVAGRPGRAPAEVAVGQGGTVLEKITVGEKSAPYAFSLSPGRASFEWRSDRPDGGHGLRLEGLTLRSKAFGALVPDLWSMGQTAAAAALLFLALARAGFSGGASAGLILSTFAAPLTLFAHVDPFACLYWLSKGAVVAALFALLFALFRRKWETLVLGLAIFSGSAALFHPAYYFKDVDIHRDVTDVVRSEGARELWSRTEFYQQKHGLGRASVGGNRRPMPYPPVLHTLAGWIPFGDTGDVLKWLGILASALTVALVMATARLLSGKSEVGIAAGVLAALFPESALELLRASYPALLGHLVDLFLVYLLLRYFEALETFRGVVGFGLAFGLSTLVYNATPLNLVVFLPLALIAFRSAAPWKGLLAASALGGFFALAYYGPFLAGLARSGGPARTPALSERFQAAFSGWDAFGPLYLVLALVGIVLVARRASSLPEGRIVIAWASFTFFISLVVFAAPEPLYYFRRWMFVYPLAPVLAAYALGVKRSVLVTGTAILVLWSVGRLGTFVEPFYLTHTGSLAPRHDEEGASDGKAHSREDGSVLDLVHGREHRVERGGDGLQVGVGGFFLRIGEERFFRADHEIESGKAIGGELDPKASLDEQRKELLLAQAAHRLDDVVVLPSQ